MTRKMMAFGFCLALAAGLLGALPATRALAATCTSEGTGNWTEIGWTGCPSGPAGSDDVVIRNGDTVTADVSTAVVNLTLQGGESGTRLVLSSGAVLDLAGTLQSDTGDPSPSLITGSGRIRFVGSSRPLFGSFWGANPPGWAFEVALDAGQTGTASTNVKAGSITVTSGTFSMGSGVDLRPDGGAPNTGTITIGPDGVLALGSPLSRTSETNKPFASFIIHGTFKTSTSNTNVWPAATPCSFGSDSVIEYSRSGGQTIQAPLGSGYGNLILSGSSTKAAAGDIEIAGDFINNGVTFNAGSYRVTFSGSGDQAIGGSAVTSFNDLTIASGSTVIIPVTNQPVVKGTLINNGVLQQTRVVSGDAEFLRITDGSGADKYRGVDIQTSDDLGSTTVAVSGNQTTCPNVLGFPARRCYAVTPANPGAADVTFHLTAAELRPGQSPNTLKLWRWTGTGTAWTELIKSGSDSTCTTASNCYVAATGVASFGDFVLQNDDPTSVTLAKFSAEQTDSHIRVTWETASELGNVGFNLYRGVSPSEPDRRLNDLLIPSQSPGNPSAGFTYIWDDDADLVPGTTYYYWLEDLDVSGATTRHGPVSVDFITPTAVTLGGLQANPAAGAGVLPLAGALLALLAPLAGAAAVGRRRRT